MKHNKIFTIPNILSLSRIVMIPFIVLLYCVAKNSVAAGILLILSGVSDIADGQIARRCGMISDLGKALDPIADKLTQGAVLLCLATRVPLVLIPLLMLACKELLLGILGCLTIYRTGLVSMAAWHGKLATALLYLLMITHLLLPSIPVGASVGAVILCSVCILLSFILYLAHFFKILKEHPLTKEEKAHETLHRRI
ncbi:MAG: CDP-alcohol phosphatidyltransferase family protein [Clostridia bacterium]|nr:CDP-alcohol phosphatidyltransferase family protein [Clostridia bacterium]MBR2926551.1 CDP-alcohol phosphatidyltransferase family protein [Clostridia bacterium]